MVKLFNAVSPKKSIWTYRPRIDHTRMMDKVHTMDFTFAGSKDFSECLNKTGSSLILCRCNHNCEEVRNVDKKIERVENKSIWTLRIDQTLDSEICFYNVSCQQNSSIFLGIIVGNDSILAEPATDKVCLCFLSTKYLWPHFSNV